MKIFTEDSEFPMSIFHEFSWKITLCIPTSGSSAARLLFQQVT